MTAFGTLHQRPRTNLAGSATPLEPLPRLSDMAGGRLWAKRDDLLPIAFGGNKVRQLEFYFGEAQAQDADTVLITGAVQSNFCRLTAAIAAKLGMACHIQAEERVPSNDPSYRASGNVLLENLLGATIHSYPDGEDEAGADAALNALADRLRDEGARPYVIPLGPGHPPLGALGYVLAAEELSQQIQEAGIAEPHIAVASGSGATHAGLLFGLRALGDQTPVTGICVRRASSLQGPRIAKRCADIAALIEVGNPVTEADIRLNDRFLAPGYGRLNLPTARAIRLATRAEALMLDPVYAGRAMAGALWLAGTLDEGSNVIFVHTGGTPGIFGYVGQMEEIAAEA